MHWAGRRNSNCIRVLGIGGDSFPSMMICASLSASAYPSTMKLAIAVESGISSRSRPNPRRHRPPPHRPRHRTQCHRRSNRPRRWQKPGSPTDKNVHSGRARAKFTKALDYIIPRQSQEAGRRNQPLRTAFQRNSDYPLVA
jgi:hypothetical protein